MSDNKEKLFDYGTFFGLIEKQTIDDVLNGVDGVDFIETYAAPVQHK